MPLLLLLLIGGCGNHGGLVPLPVALHDHPWRFIEVQQQAVPPAGEMDPPQLMIATEDNRYSGFTGCNRLFGSYQLTGERLRFGATATTRSFCAGIADQEQRLLAALERTTHYRIEADQLLLLRDNEIVARLTPVASDQGEKP